MSKLARALAPLILVPALAAAAALAGPVAAQDAVPAAGQTPVWAFEQSDLPSDPAVLYGRLDNGMRYAILHNATPGGTGALRLRIAAGSLMEDEDQRGLAHVLEHMAFNGSQNVPEGEMVRILEREGLEFGPDTNAYTSVDETVYMLDLPQVDDETLDTGLTLFREIAGRLLIAPDALDRERGVVLSEKRVRNTYSSRYQTAAQAFLYKGARFPDRDPIGVDEVLNNAPASRVRDFYETYYRPDRAILVFVGDAPPEDIEARIRATFSDWTPARPDGGDPDRGGVAERELEADVFADPDMPTVVTISASRDAEPYLDTIEARRDRLVRTLGFAMLSRRFQRLARSADAPFISASADYSRAYDTLESADVTMVAENGKWRDALEAGEIELRRALEYGFSDSELQEQLVGYSASLQAAADGADTRRTPRLADALVGALGSDTVFTHPRSNLERFETIASSLTVDEVDAAFRAAWAGAQPEIFLGANEAPEGGPEAITAAYLESLEAPVEAGVEHETEDFAYDDLGPPGEVVEQSRIDDLDVTEARFANNVRLNVKPTEFSEDRVSVTVRVGSGRLELPKNLPGLEFLAESTFVQGGLAAHSLDDLQTLFAGRNVGLSFYTSNDAFVFSATTTPEDLALQLKLFAAYVADPGYREEAITRFRRSLDAWYESLDSTPTGVQSRDVPRLLRSGDPRYGVPDRAAVDALNLDELRMALADAFEHGAVEIGIVGDVDVEDAVQVVADSFGALPERSLEQPAFDAARAASFPAPTPEPVVLHHNGEPDRALALVYWPTVDDSDRMQTRRIAFAREVFQLKLTDRVREEDGASYSPSAFASFSGTSPGYGYMGASLDVEPQLVDGYFDTVDEIVASMAAGEVSEDEMERARAPILADIAESLESNGYWLGLITTAQTKPRYLDSHRTRAADYAAITRQDVIDVAEQYLRPERAYRIAILPEPATETAGGGEPDAG